MKSIPIIFIGLLVGVSCYGQKNIKAYVDTATKAITTIEPDSINYADLETIGNAIGDKRVVMLGEQDHGDAPTFLAKTRLIKYLHEKKGFNVLAFESDFYGLNDGWDRLEKTKPAMADFVLRNIFGIWTICNTCDNLFYKYLPATYQSRNPLILTGFDSQQYLNYSLHHLNHNLDSVLRVKDLPITKQADYTTEILPLIDSSKKWNFKKPANIGRVNKCIADLQTIKAQLTATPGDNDLWLMTIDNLTQQANGIKTEMETGKPATEARDVQMATNLQWLIEHKFKDQKIIVWAASYHVSKSLKNVGAITFHDKVTMGARLAETLNAPNEVYTLGFATYAGTAGRLGGPVYKVSTRKKNSYEAWLNDKGYKYAFTDFSAFNKQNTATDEDFNMAPLGHFTTSGKWNRVFDGIFFIRDTYNCKELSYSPLSK